MRGDFHFPNEVVFGPGRVRELPTLVRGWGSRALIVSDPGIMGTATPEPVLDALAQGELNFRVFEGVEHNPDEACVMAGVRRFEEGCDFIIALGGGSALDAGKAIRLAVSHEGPLSRYDREAGGEALIRADMPPMVAIPTTAGTGSEVSRGAVITLEHRKVELFSRHLLPAVALCDPELTLDLSAGMTSGTGAEALAHNVEAYFSSDFHPLCDALALEGMRRAARWLPVAVREPSNLEARSEMMLAALMGGVAFQKGLGAAHSLANALVSVAGTQYGVANAVLLPRVLRFNREASAPRAGAAAEALGVEAATVPEETVDRIADALAGLFTTIGLPSRLRDLSVASPLLGPMVDLALRDAGHLSSPRALTAEAAQALYREAM